MDPLDAVSERSTDGIPRRSYSSGCVLGKAIGLCPSSHWPRRLNNFTRSKRFKTLRLAPTDLFAFRLGCWDMVLNSNELCRRRISAPEVGQETRPSPGFLQGQMEGDRVLICSAASRNDGATKGTDQKRTPPGGISSAFRGVGRLGGFGKNPKFDPPQLVRGLIGIGLSREVEF